AVSVSVEPLLRPLSTTLPVFFPHPSTTQIYTLSLHDALPICHRPAGRATAPRPDRRISPAWAMGPAARTSGARSLLRVRTGPARSEEHTSELQSRVDLVCRLLLEKKKEMSSHF